MAKLLPVRVRGRAQAFLATRRSLAISRAALVRHALARSALALLVLFIAAPPAAAQDDCTGEDTCMGEPPSVTITPSSRTVASASLQVTIEWEDVDGLDDDSREIRLNGVVITDSLDYDGWSERATSSGTITLREGSNTLTAEICDINDLCSDLESATYTYDNNDPSVVVSPSGGDYKSSSVGVTIDWSDAGGLDLGSRTITVNGQTVIDGSDTDPADFTHSGSGTSSQSVGTVFLEPGSNTLTAEICDRAGNCGSDGGTYYYDTAAPGVSIDPSGGTYANASRLVTITWTDNRRLDTASDTIWLNNEVKTSSFTYSGSATSATSTGTVTLSPGTNTLKAKICDRSGRCRTKTASYTFFDERLAPTVSTAPHNGANIDVSRCIAGCFEATVSYTTLAYVSLDAPRSATLIYRSGRASPRGFVQLDAQDPGSSTAPDKLSLRLKANGAWVKFTTNSDEIFYTYPGNGAMIRMAAQFDASTLSTGAYVDTAVVRSWWSDGTVKATEVPVRIIILNERASPFGAGWWLAGYQRIHFTAPGGLLVTEGDGSAVFFEGGICQDVSCTYDSPAGEFSTFELEREIEECGVEDCGPVTYRSTHYERRYVDGTKVYFTLSGRDSLVVDRFGNRTTYGYDAQGRLSSITDPAGKKITFGYGADGKLETIQDPAGRTTTLTINVAGDLTAIRDPANALALQASYAASHRMRRRTDRRGGVWAFAYGFDGLMTRDTLPEVTVDGASVRPVIHYRSLERELLEGQATGKGSATNPVSPINPGSVRVEVTNPRGYVTRFAVDRFGAPTRIEEPLGRVTQIWRNAAGQDTLSVSPSGHRVRKEWAGANLTKVEDLTTGEAVHLTYASFGEVQSVTGDVVPVWNYWSGGSLDSTRAGTPSSPVTKYTYDSRGRLLTRTDPRGHIARSFYASGGFMNTDSVKDGNRRTKYTYDAYGRVQTVTNPLNQTTTTVYDLLNRIGKAIGPDADTTIYTYDALYLTQVRDAIGQTHSFFPNALGWNDSIADPGGRKQYFSYDRNGNVVAQVNRRDQTTTTAYDALDRPTQITLSDGRTINYAYAPDDRWVAGWNVARDTVVARDTLRFDVAGRLEYQITVRNGTRYVLKSSYDNRSQRTRLQMTTPWSRTVRYHYNEFGALDSLINVAGQATAIGYNDDLQANVIELPSVTITKRLPSAHRTAEITYSNAALNDAFGVLYGLDENKQVVQRTNQAGDSVRTFAYDDLGRLTGYEDSRQTTPSCEIDWDDGYLCDDETSSTPLGGESYSYDKVGNRTDHGASYQTGNRLVSFDGWTYTYDEDGNVEHKYKAGVLDLHLYWNSIGQLDSVRSNGNIMRYVYDAFGRRIRKSGYSIHQRSFIYDGDDLFLELDAGTGNLLAEYAFYPGTSRPHSMRRGGTMYYYATDHLGTVLGLFQGTSVTDLYRYDPWGQGIYANQPVYNKLRYAGSYYDNETAFYYMRARYYDRALGRFISQDPIGLAGGINPYVYAGNSPVTHRDPSGLCTEDGKIEEGEICELDPIEVTVDDDDNGGGGPPPPAWPPSTPPGAGAGGPGDMGGFGGGGGPGVAGPTASGPTFTAQCYADLGGLALATVGTVAFGAAFTRIGVNMLRAWGQGLVARGLAPQAMQYGLSNAVTRSIAASQAHMTVAGVHTSLYVAEWTSGLAGIEGQTAAGQNPSLTGFLLDALPVVGMVRAGKRVNESCNLF